MANMFQFGYQPFDDARSYLRPFAIHRQRMIRLGHDSVPNTNYKREIELYPYFTGKKWYPCDVGTVTIPIKRGEEGGGAERRDWWKFQRRPCRKGGTRTSSSNMGQTSKRDQRLMARFEPTSFGLNFYST